MKKIISNIGFLIKVVNLSGFYSLMKSLSRVIYILYLVHTYKLKYEYTQYCPSHEINQNREVSYKISVS
jgi:hypothetical protein